MALSKEFIEAAVSNPSFISEVYSEFLVDPNHVTKEWSQAFHCIEEPSRSEKPLSDSRIFKLIESYKIYGHLIAELNPISLEPIEEPWQLNIENFGFNKNDLKNNFPTLSIIPNKEIASLQEIIDALRVLYSDKITVEFTGIQEPLLESWLRQKIENKQLNVNLSIDEKKLILQYLNKSELFESFLHTKYIGQKRFSLEGGETLIPMLAILLEKGSELGMRELIIGMAHRGRLNILTNILNKSYATVFSEFEENYIPQSFEGSGDVKYHKGYTSKLKTLKDKEINIILSPNPSHLEAVYPVIEGLTRGKEIAGHRKTEEIVPLIIHGDAAIAGQGVVYETLQMSRLEGYFSGGTIHIVINNHIGFTTLPKEYCSTTYCTDIAKAFDVPVFHVNAEDPESCIYAMILAIEIRQKFKCDVFIDLNCYRKYGHNESDEPSFTQPLEYKLINNKLPIRELYRDHLIKEGIIEKELVDSLEEEFRNSLNKALELSKSELVQEVKAEAKAARLNPFVITKTAISNEIIDSLAIKMTTLPETFKAHKKLIQLNEDRKNILLGEPKKEAIDWGTAEILAYASILNEGIHVRISGQDVKRGTFSHRHAVLVDQEKEQSYTPLQFINKDQNLFEIYNSPLSEYAVLGFEYGYSIACPNALVIWEAQFGDFGNGAQVMIDQFISTAEQKWGQISTITLFLPHGYEGQGPEHSSARMERFLILSGDDNWQIVYPSTPSQFFHLLRRQVHSQIKKPLIVFTPKALLRHPKCQSSLFDIYEGNFKTIIDDNTSKEDVLHLIFCTGKIYYDLVQELEKKGNKNSAIIRIEQLYPFDSDGLKKIFQKYKNIKTCCWVQEEPSNMGAWNYMDVQFKSILPENITLKYIGRKRSASPAVGSYFLHKKQHSEMMEELDKVIS